MHIEEHKRLAPYTTIGLGGPARWFVSCSNEEDIREALKWAETYSHKIFVLAGGSNSLIADAGFPGLVIHIGLKGMEWKESGTVRVSAGEDWDPFVQSCLKRGFSGLESLSGIPGSVGSTPIQNVGAYGQEVKDTIVGVTAINRTSLKSVYFSNQDCDFSYRMSRFKGQGRDQFIITSVDFKLKTDSVAAITYPELERTLMTQPQWQNHNLSRSERLQLIRDTVIGIRSGKGMVIRPSDPDSRSLGSFFMNPIVSTQDKERIIQLAAAESILPAPNAFPAGDNTWKLSAAWLIEHSGTRKGEQLGGAAVSSKHSLALINRDRATTDDILKLANKIRDRVRRKFDIELHQEPELIR